MNRKLAVVFLAFVLCLPLLASLNVSSIGHESSSSTTPELVDLGNGETIEVGPNEQLHKLTLSEQGWDIWTGTSSGLIGAEYGNRTDQFLGLEMVYDPTNTTTGESTSIPTGTGWEGYRAEAAITGLTENRTWTLNPGFQDGTTSWTLATTPAGGNSEPYSEWADDGHGVGDDCLNLTILSDDWPGGATQFYDAGDRAYASQTMTIPRLDIVWSAFTFEYWVNNTHFSSISLYVAVEGDAPDNSAWQETLPNLGSEGVWQTTGLQEVPVSLVDIAGGVPVEVGLWSKRALGYQPGLPNVRIDNFEFYFKTEVLPSDVNLEMNDIPVVDVPSTNAGTVTDTPATAWQTNPILLNFTWWPTPTNPDPNRTINVEFDITTNMFARRTGIPTVYEVNPIAYGEFFSVMNDSSVEYTSYFRVSIPTGYANNYFFNISTPTGRDIQIISRPGTAPNNLTVSEWTYITETSGLLNISASDITTEAGMKGYWRFVSYASNMVSDTLMEDPNTTSWVSEVNLRAGNTTRVQANIGIANAGAIANVTVFDPSGTVWYTENVTVDGLGYAESKYMSFDGANSSAGQWMVQVSTNNWDLGSHWNDTGFYRREFTITHSTDLLITYPNDAVGTWITNATYGEFVLVILEVNDTDSNILITGGQLNYTIDALTGSFESLVGGEYTAILNTSKLPGKGQFTMNLDWTLSFFDGLLGELYINVNYPSILSSPEYPGVSAPLGTDQSFTMRFVNGNAGNGTGIVGATLICNWTGSYTVTDNLDGTYDFLLDVAGLEIGNYTILVTATAPFVVTQTEFMLVDITEIFTTRKLSSNQLTIPVGESKSFNITWKETLSGNPITDGLSFINCDWYNYSISHIGNGVYNVTIKTSSSDALTPYGEWVPLNFTMERVNYENHTFVVKLRISSHQTLLSFDDPTVQTSFGQDITVTVFYQDTDLNVGINNASGLVRVTVTSPDVSPLTYSSIESVLGDGHYNITIPSDQWGTIGWKNLTILFEWIGAVQKYNSQTLEDSVRILGTETEVRLELVPTATYYLDNITFTVVYWDAINSSRISNSSYGGGNVILVITPIISGHPVDQSYFQVVEFVAPSGTYEFRLNTSSFGDIGTFQFMIDFKWASGTSPYYENQTMTVNFVILSRPTYVSPSPIQSSPYGESAIYEFGFIDSLTTTRIPNSGSLSIDINEGYVSYTLAYDSETRLFTITIDTSSLGGIGTFSLHLNVTWVGDPFYQSIQSQSFTVSVVLRTTQLTHSPFAPGQWGNNVTISFTYTDLVSGLTTGMDGILTLNISASYYIVNSLGDGQFTITLNTSYFASAGEYMLNASIVYTGGNYASDTFEIFGFTVLFRATQLGYESPDPAQYGTNVTLFFSYSDDTTGNGIDSATITLSCTNASLLLIEGVTFWVTNLGFGEYIIEIDSIALGNIGVFVLNVTASKSGPPHYALASREINSRVIQRATQILITQTPGETPYLENVTFRFKFEDILTGSLIAIGKEHITLRHGPSLTLILPSEYSLTLFATYYEISLNSTDLDISLVSLHQIVLDIDKSGGVPYYAPRSVTTYATTVERPTQILFPLIEATPYGNNITMEINFIDYLTKIGIEGASITLQCVNLTTFANFTYDLGGGAYRILIPSSQFGNLGTVRFNITLSKSGSPFFSIRIAYNVPAQLRFVFTSLTSETPAAGSIPVGDLIVLNLTLVNRDHDVPILNALFSTSWSYGTDYVFAEVGAGFYTLTINTTGLLAQVYSFSVQAELMYHQTANITVEIQPGAAVVEIILDKTTYFASWGESPFVKFNVQEPYHGTYVHGMNATLLFNGQIYLFTDIGNGTYTLYLPTYDAPYGTYNPRITVTQEFYQTRQKSFTLVVSKATGQMNVERTYFSVVVNTSVYIWVYLNDTILNAPITGASVSAEWNNTVLTLVQNGTAGFYDTIIDVSGFPIGPAELVLLANSDNHVFLDAPIDIYIVPIYTRLDLVDGQTSLTVYYGETLDLAVWFNDTYYGGSISGAAINYTLSSLTDALDEEIDGTYRISINTSSLAAQSIYLRISASKIGYATSSKTILITILPLDMKLDGDILTVDGYNGDVIELSFVLTDVTNGIPVSGASGEAFWEGGAGTITDLGNGTYILSFLLNLTTPRNYEMSLVFNKQNYRTSTLTIQIAIKATPASILSIPGLSLPVNKSAEVLFILNNDITNESILGLNGVAIWSGIGETTLDALENGSYILSIPDDLPIDDYTIQVYFTTSIYQISPITFHLEVRRVTTIISVERTVIPTFPGASIVILATYYDLDNNIGISGANLLISYDENDITYYPALTNEPWNNGTYEMFFSINQPYTFNVTFTFSHGTYETSTISIEIQSDVSAQQEAMQMLYVGGGASMILLAAFLLLYIRVFSIPKLIRAMTRMIKSLAKGRVPKPADVSLRGPIIAAIVNEELKSLSIQKSVEEFPSESIEMHVPEVEELLERLVEITGLGAVEVDAFRADLATMKASERPGFLKEVIVQEEARRAEALAFADDIIEPEVDTETLAQKPEDMQEIREKLVTKGMAPEEIDVILEEAKNLSKADLSALLDSLGLSLE